LPDLARASGQLPKIEDHLESWNPGTVEPWKLQNRTAPQGWARLGKAWQGWRSSLQGRENQGGVCVG